jgi:peptide chain release factor 1
MAKEVDENIPEKDLFIETTRSRGAGGQHVNTTDSCVRITHLPTGMIVNIQDERSQHKNRALALKIISARIADLKRIELQKERSDARNSMIGTGGRSERIRTYNFPQDRITDHRIHYSELGIEAMLSKSFNRLLLLLLLLLLFFC